ncbi:MAG TPA: Rieske 2Fe-2S domain-containing protein [Blastocatellia bacterium]|nr:Rieske 2Fe-2S domain-containing protein [Blastocatellia bacterium]
MVAQSETVEECPAGRRSFLGAVSGLIAAGIAAVLGVTIGRYAITPALAAAAEAEWTDAGSLAGIPEGRPVRRSVVVAQQAGWGRFSAERLVWVSRQGENITVFSAVCPHLGCTVNTGKDGFVCACHSSRWNAGGEKLGGPTPRNLDVLEHRVEGDLLKIRYQNFRQGTPAKEVMS